MFRKSLLGLSVLFLWLGGPSWTALAQDAAVSAKQWPVGYFHQYRKVSLPEKEKILAKIDAALKKLNAEKGNLVVKGSVIDPLRPDLQTYKTLSVLDESGLILVVRNVPNIYYGYPGPPAGLNKNIYLVAKNARLNKTESYIKYWFVVEAEFLAFVDKYMRAIMKEVPPGWENLK
jgi:hypothetical protein